MADTLNLEAERAAFERAYVAEFGPASGSKSELHDAWYSKLGRVWLAARRSTSSVSKGEMPELPEPDHALDCGMQPFYRPDQMHAYAHSAVLAERARQGKPLECRAESGAWSKCQMAAIEAYEALRRPRAATKAEAPADAPKDQKAAFTEYVQWCAENKHVPMAYSTFKLHAEDAREEVRGEVAKLRAALKPFADAYAPEAERVARFYTPDDLAKYGEVFDRNTVTPAVTMGDFRRAYETSRRASSVPAIPGADEGAEFLAEVFNRLTQEQKLSVPQEVAGRLGAFMARNGYRIVFGRWYSQAAPSHPLEAKAGEDA